MIVMPESMDFSQQRFSAIVYGSPGVGKTTLAYCGKLKLSDACKHG